MCHDREVLAYKTKNLYIAAIRGLTNTLHINPIACAVD